MLNLRIKTSVAGVALLVVALSGCERAPDKTENPRVLIEKMVQAVGGRDRLYALKDVEYEYTYHNLTTDKRDVSTERYVFDGELSWAKYSVREKSALPQLQGELIEGYNGKQSWATLDGRLIQDPKALRIVDFTRKTNFYWFTMMFKLLDPGVNFSYKGTKNIEGVDYDLVGVTFDENVGDAQDTYVLYINPKTHLVDQFLFTVMDFGVSQPFLMKVQYEEVEGLKLPAKRRFAPADWEGQIRKEEWSEELSQNIHFNNGFSREMFDPPTTGAISSKN